MTIRITSLSRAALVLGLCLFAGSAWAQATRTWVSGVGDDANPCSRTAPCKTLAGAISKTAAKGVISVLDPGGYGGLTITKAITIDGSAVNGSVLVSGTNGINVSAGVNDVVRLRNISLEGISNSVHGVRFNTGAALLMDNVHVHDFSAGHGVYFAPSGTSRLVINDCTFTNNKGGSGVRVQPGAAGLATVSIANSKLNNNVVGLEANDRSVVSVRGSAISSNDSYGVIAFSSGDAVEVNLDGNQVVNNGLTNASAAGVRSNGNLASVVISDNVVSGNPRGIHPSNGGDIFSFGSNRVIGNTFDGAPTGNVSSL